ncbi:SLC13 family permease [Microbulbifer hydrolyticus]|uniref:Di/tricarboxylate transporter n=1 Tax=Microbulbifer hydrolyticus TaxID=48074 RepID=A0A6P1TBL6_9GAMM|nr:SLC13 family permease [Microbulbifer hydrolyticus]MBB5211173.1 di/tricarboxylate transporter [Microbulbifer hydrolyticus]QHQ38052.1 TRAP transporter large permease subunit [Microbulbifer hydrolyticus]
MDWSGWFSLFLVFAVLATLIFTRIQAYLVMMAALTLLSVSGILTPAEALSGFSNSGLITVAAMFVVAAGIHSSGGIDMMVKHLLGRPNTVRSAMLRVFAPVVALSGYLNNTPVVATMIPALNAWAKRIDIAPSKLMIPLSYGAILGGTLTLIGTSTNLVVNGQYQAITGSEGFSLFSIAAVGLPAALVGIAFMLLFFPRWLPDRREKKPFGNLREFTLEVAIDSAGPLVGQTVEDAGLRGLRRVYLVEIERDGRVITPVRSGEKLRGGDRLVFAGDTEAISDLLRMRGIVPSDHHDGTTVLTSGVEERRLVEVVVSPQCEVIGSSIRDAQFRARYGAAVLAVAREGRRVAGNLGSIKLKAGDSLLLEARPGFVMRQRYSKDFLLINDLEAESPRHEKGLTSWLILIAIVLAAGTGLISMLNASLIGAGAMLLTRCCSVNQAQKSLDLPVLITIAASFALGVALQKTGVAAMLAEGVISLSYGHPWLMLILIYLCVSLLTEMVTNNAAAIIMVPIVLQITASAGLNPEPFMFAVMMAASASFATPLGYQTNLMVYGPGGYRFSDYLKVGIPMNLLVGAVTVTILLTGWDLTLAR